MSLARGLANICELIFSKQVKGCYLNPQNDFIGLSYTVVPEHFQYKKMAEKRIQTNISI